MRLQINEPVPKIPEFKNGQLRYIKRFAWKPICAVDCPGPLSYLVWLEYILVAQRYLDGAWIDERRQVMTAFDRLHSSEYPRER
jgi:hypothetical protein